MSESYNAGRITIETRLDTSNLEKDLTTAQKRVLASMNKTQNLLKRTANNVKNTFKNTASALSNAVKNTSKAKARLNKDVAFTQKILQSYSKQISKATDKLVKLKEKTKALEREKSAGNKSASNELKKTNKELSKLELKINKYSKIYQGIKNVKQQMITQSEPVISTEDKPTTLRTQREVNLASFHSRYSDTNEKSGLSMSEKKAEKIKQSLKQILAEYNLTYSQLEAREHENMLKRQEITGQEYLHLQGLLNMTNERIRVIMQENSIAYVYFKDYLKQGFEEFSGLIGNSLVTALRQGKNAFTTFGKYFMDLLNKMIDRLIIMITKLLVIKTLSAIFGGGGGLLGGLFGLKTGGGVSKSGKVYKGAGGMYVSDGTHSTADDVPVLLSRGEGVLNAKVTQMLGGEPAIRSLNKTGSVKGYSQGGFAWPGGDTITNVNVQGNIIDTQGLIDILDEQARNSGKNSLFDTGGLV